MREQPAASGFGPPMIGLDRVYSAHSGLVFRTAYRITGNAADAEDVLQTVFLRLMRRDQAAGALENEESYLRRAAVNVSLDLVRSKQAARAVPIDDAPPSQLAEGKSQDMGELKECLRRALAHLNRRDAEVFALRFFEGHENPEIARILGISQVHVAVILHRTRKQLQKEVRSYMGEKS
ncbi:MAG TPA: sigma-70 family RNA polymerase sigma factor [Bryobacteraceae bacterium]|nr:sigma-70 family RNA polymerase sigma factor [Bryobacteraceae bacterium]